MYTKSQIQQIIDSKNILESFQNGLVNLLDKYMIEDSIFVATPTTNGSITTNELTAGYFEQISEHDNLNDALKNFNINECGIRIVNNNKYYVGKIHKNLSQCKDLENVYDVYASQNVL